MKRLTKQTLRIYWQHSKQYSGSISVLAGSLVVYMALEIYVPFWYRKFFNILAEGNTQNTEPLISIIIIILAVNLVSWLFRRINHFASNFVSTRVMSDLRNTCYEYLQQHSNNFFNNSFVGSLVRRVNRFAHSYDQVFELINQSIGRAILYIISIIGVLLFLYWQLALVIIIWVIFYIVVNYWFAKYKLKYDIQRAAMDTKTSGHLSDTVTNNYNIKLFSSLKSELGTYKKLTNQLFKLYKKARDLREYADAIQVATMMLLEFIILYFAIGFWRQGILTIGDFALLQAYMGTIFGHLWGLGRHIQRSYEALAEAEEMTEILEKPHEIQDVAKAKKLNITSGKIQYKNVNFYYPGQKTVFNKFDLDIKAGERVALIGPSGGGKSTFVKLLFRFFDIQKGQILIDNQEIAKVTQDSLRSNLSLVPQDPILFHRSLIENIRYGKRSATNEEVMKVAKLAHCHEFIAKFPEGYQTMVGERGVKLSGGERQRVAIARAMLENAPILVLDEATSSLDSESEYFIQDALKTLMKGKTTIVIAHRLSTIMQMDKIIVLEGGKITEQGTHQELLNIKKGTYQKLWGIQAGGFNR